MNTSKYVPVRVNGKISFPKSINKGQLPSYNKTHSRKNPFVSSTKQAPVPHKPKNPLKEVLSHNKRTHSSSHSHSSTHSKHSSNGKGKIIIFQNGLTQRFRSSVLSPQIQPKFHTSMQIKLTKRGKINFQITSLTPILIP